MNNPVYEQSCHWLLCGIVLNPKYFHDRPAFTEMIRRIPELFMRDKAKLYIEAKCA
ncbi:MAG: hypothetical protein OEW13_02745 [Nitrospira sp.]|nr:hypothetical protein [Nitrospira sp.]MDH5496995.1 hypothetical protein [Nitrospira sp.]